MHVRSYPGAPRGGDVGVIVLDECGALAALVDATGHGLTAYAVAQAARKILLQTSSREPDVVLQELDATLAGSIGAAISVAHVRPHELAFSGVGNVSASIGLRPMLVRPGVVGRRMRKPAVARMAFEPNTWLLMHTDGVSRPDTIPAGDAETAARALVEAKGSHHDDAGVLLLRWRERRP